MKAAYLILLPANQVSVSVGQVPWMLARAMYPEGWEFWESRGALFDQLVARLRDRVSESFSSRLVAVKEVHSILKNRNEPKLNAVLLGFSGSNFYQLYLTAVHHKLLFRAIADGGVKRIEHNPTGRLSDDPLVDVAELVINDQDRIVVQELARYLRDFDVELRQSSEDGWKTITPDGRMRLPEGVNEVRGRLILSHLELLGHDPANLRYVNGRSGARYEVKERLWELQPQEFAHRTRGFNRSSFDGFFKKAWDWLKENELVHNKKAEK